MRGQAGKRACPFSYGEEKTRCHNRTPYKYCRFYR